MPNWVFTTMTVSGKETDLRNFMWKASAPYATYFRGVRTINEDGTPSFDANAIDEKVHTGCISFMNFRSPENRDAYFASAHPEDGWYEWNAREWGTKWDACNPEMTQDDPSTGVVEYRFDTAWTPAEGAFTAIVAQHPELRFHFHCEEETGWGVEYLGEGGDFSLIREWIEIESEEVF